MNIRFHSLCSGYAVSHTVCCPRSFKSCNVSPVAQVAHITIWLGVCAHQCVVCLFFSQYLVRSHVRVTVNSWVLVLRRGVWGCWIAISKIGALFCYAYTVPQCIRLRSRTPPPVVPVAHALLFRCAGRGCPARVCAVGDNDAASLE